VTDLPIQNALVFSAAAPPFAVEALETCEAGQWRDALEAAASASSYLASLIARDHEAAQFISKDGPDGVFAQALDAVRALPGDDFEQVMAALRRAKRRAHLAIACADLALRWPLEQVTLALSEMADAAVAASVRAIAVLLQQQNLLVPTVGDAAGPIPGLVLLAMGKLGAFELNYSSDIDITVFFDPDRLPLAKGVEPSRAAVRIAQALVRAMEEPTVDGYVFRTDLRLRPDPASTPIAVSLPAAERYYQSVGQNWERAAFIKARPCGGDIQAAEDFLRTLTPYIWRSSLDYAAIADVQSIKRQILARKSADIDSPIFDVKLGRGGIRDIELFAQTQQLILGGRDKRLRVRGTKEALATLALTGVLEQHTEEELCEAYTFHRMLEHRIQMLADEQTHQVPQSVEGRAKLAALAGYENWEAFAPAIVARRRRVAAHDAKLFGQAESLADPLGSLVFTGVEDDPETLATLVGMGFKQPSAVAGIVRGWHHGRIRATRTERAREILTAIMPRLLRAIAASGEPDLAFARFDGFLGGLTAGVQTLSLFRARPDLLDDLALVLGLAPSLSESLARRPVLLDAMVEATFAAPVSADPPGARLARLRLLAEEAGGFEEAINAARRFHREETLRIAAQTLRGALAPADAGRAFSDLADACVAAIAEVARAEVERLHGTQPGAFVVLGLGKLGGRELTMRSDLDIMLVYDADPQAESRGKRPAGATEFYTKLTQRLISGLSAPTPEGLLYEVDMQLRPSGSAGPVAVRLAAFERYYREDAWTWELLALTRARVVAGDQDLAARVQTAIDRALALPREKAKVLEDVREMRARLDRERPGRGVWDLKLAPGGLVDLEFAAQASILAHAPDARVANTGEAFTLLAQKSVLDAATHALFAQAFELYSDMQQVTRICLPDLFDPAQASERFSRLLAEAGGETAFPALEARVQQTQARVRPAFLRLLGAPGRRHGARSSTK
jgi:glutamate-ammonia-ligase adenylyltransferase